MDHTQKTIDALQATLREMESVLVAFSGGVDSTFLLKVAVDTLGRENVLAVTGVSESLVASELTEAEKLARHIGAHHVTLDTDELSDEGFVANSPNRCYHCKSVLFGRLVNLASERGLRHVIDGSNRDDRNDYRPGMRAAMDFGVRSPLQEVGLTKAQIREASRALGLPTWSKAAAPCLASRIPYGTPVTVERLQTIAAAEAFLRQLGFQELRVRHHDSLARIELPPADMTALLDSDCRERVVQRLRELGFRYITLDMQGFRSGSLNEVIPLALRTSGGD